MTRNTPENHPEASPAASLAFIIAEYRERLTDFNSRSFATDEESEVYAESSIKPFEQILANWTEPATSLVEVGAALQLAIDDLRGSAESFLTLPLVTAALAYVTEAVRVKTEVQYPSGLDVNSVSGLFAIYRAAENAQNGLLGGFEQSPPSSDAKELENLDLLEKERLLSRSDDLLKLSMAAFDAMLSQDCQTLEDAALKMREASEWLCLGIGSHGDYSENNQRILASFLPLFRKSNSVYCATMTAKGCANG